MKNLFKYIGIIIKESLFPFLIFSLILSVGVASLSPYIFYNIMPGEAGICWRRFAGGTETEDVYPEGLQAIWPWDKLYIYNIRIQEVAPEMDVLTNTGLRIHLLVSIRFSPKRNLLGLLHKKVGPEYPKKVIIPEVEAVLREVIGRMGAEEIYTTGRKPIIKAINKAIEQVAQRYIDVDDVLIKRMDLPASVAEAIRYKIEQKHLVEAHKFIVEREKIEAERKRIEGEGIRD